MATLASWKHAFEFYRDRGNDGERAAALADLVFPNERGPNALTGVVDAPALFPDADVEELHAGRDGLDS